MPISLQPGLFDIHERTSTLGANIPLYKDFGQ
jgi:hypothetical protein